MQNNIPAFEVIVCAPTESFRWTVHDYPHHLAKWHYHPEYELHLIRRTSGRMMVGDYVGDFEPGTLILTGPNLPHHWVSHIGKDVHVPGRDMLIQFTPEFAETLAGEFAEMRLLRPLFTEAAHGLLFDGETATEARRLLAAVGKVQGPRRLTLFLELLDTLRRRPQDRRQLSHCAPALGVHTPVSKRLDAVMDHLYRNFRSEIRLAEVAELCNLEVSTFSRFFKKQTGHTFARFVNQLRVHHACALLSDTELPVTLICFDSGFNNTANFNRQFVAFCRQTPSRYRQRAREIARRSEGIREPA